MNGLRLCGLDGIITQLRTATSVVSNELCIIAADRLLDCAGLASNWPEAVIVYFFVADDAACYTGIFVSLAVLLIHCCDPHTAINVEQTSSTSLTCLFIMFVPR